MTHQGYCHCGRIAYEAGEEPAQVIECNCSHHRSGLQPAPFDGRDGR